MVTLLILALVLLAISSGQTSPGGSSAGSPGLTWSAATRQRAKSTTMQASMVFGSVVSPTWGQSVTPEGTVSGEPEILKRLEDIVVYSHDGSTSIDVGSAIIPISFKNAETDDERWGGMNIVSHPDKFWDMTLKIRHSRIVPEHPMIVGWKNRMPYDVGHRHRRWYYNKIRLQHPDGGEEVVTDTGVPAILDPAFMMQIHGRIYDAIDGYTRRRWALALRSETHNEAWVPEGGDWRRRLGYAYPFMSAIFYKSFCTTNYIILCDRSRWGGEEGDSGPSVLRSVVCALYAPITCNNARSFRRKAKAFIWRSICAVASIVGAFLGIGGGATMAGEIFDQAQSWTESTIGKIVERFGFQGVGREIATQYLFDQLKGGVQYGYERLCRYGSGSQAAKVIDALETGKDMFDAEALDYAAEYADTVKRIEIIIPRPNNTW